MLTYMMAQDEATILLSRPELDVLDVPAIAGVDFVFLVAAVCEAGKYLVVF
jgi:hypothetical protein